MNSYIVSWPVEGRRHRSRIVFACLPCHSRKIKCDRSRPCRRCIAAGRAAECGYQTRQLSPLSAKETSAKFPSLALLLRGKPRMGTATSWIKLMWEFSEARPYLFGTDPEHKAMFDRIRLLKEFFLPVVERIFPLGAPPPASGSQSHLLSEFPDRPIAETFLKSYLETFETLFPLWHEATYVDEMAGFWANPEDASWSFFAQLFMMMGLGCHAMQQEQLQDLGLDGQGLSKSYFNLAATAVGGSLLTTSYDYVVLRALCMSVFARMMDLITQDDEKDCSIVIGMTVRVAQAMNLHRHPSLFVGMQEAEMTSRVRIWTTLVLLDLLSSIHSSLPLIIHSGDYDACARIGKAPPADTNGCTVKSDSAQISFELILAELLPKASHIVRMANSVNQELEYIRVEELDHGLREILDKATTLYVPTDTLVQSAHTHRVQSEILRIIIRRVMLILHEPFGRLPNAAINFKTSYIGLIECSLALAVSQGTLYDEHRPGGGAWWALNFFKEDFQIAIVYISLGIRGQSFDNEALAISQSTPKRIAWNTLRRAVEITERQAGDSIKHFQIFLGVCYLVAVLECLESGAPMREKMVETGKNVISLVERVKRRRLDDLSIAADLALHTSDTRSQSSLASDRYGTKSYDINIQELHASILS